ncbi:MAG: hypothetical protein WC455_15615 [Dehalococcoidia bacterium]|jgi:hypothetical protein
MNYFEPELGQAVVGKPWQLLDCPPYIERGLEFLGYEVARVTGCESPTGNNGESFANDTFRMNSYYWGDCTCGFADIEYNERLDNWFNTHKLGPKGHARDCLTVRPNFAYEDIEVSWYKYLGRGMSINRQVSEKEAASVIKNCLQSLWNVEK